MQKHFDPLHLPFWVVPLYVKILLVCDDKVALYCMWQDVMRNLDAFDAYPIRVRDVFRLLRDLQGGTYVLLLVLNRRAVCTNL